MKNNYILTLIFADLEGDNLYSIKWYRNGHEFYRYIPSDHPQTTIFNGNGINVDVRFCMLTGSKNKFLNCPSAF